MKYAFFILITVMSIYSCNHQKQEDQYIISKDSFDIIVGDSWNYPERLWRLDSLGCMGIRQKQDIDIESIVEHYSLWNKSSAEFCNIFGKPNKRKFDAEETNIEYLTYYLEAKCNGDTIDYKSDKAYVVFEFVNDSLLKQSFLYMIE